MYGFLVTRGISSQEVPFQNGQELFYGNVRFCYHPMPKFENDKLFFEDEEKIVLLDGVIFNNCELMAEYGCNTWKEALLKMYQRVGAELMKDLRGSFAGAIYEKRTDTLTAFTNQSGEKTIYYSQQADFFVLASHNNLLLPVLRGQGISVTPDLQSARELVATGSILHGKTPFIGVERLTAGKSLRQSGNTYTEERYHMFHNIPEHTLSLEECVEEVDKRFRKAVDRIFAKNKEYGYQGECDLSGGLDSRMVAWVAHDLGYRDILNVCYCQKGNIDHTTSEKIASDLGNQYFFLPMDGGDFLEDIDEAIDKFGGQVTYVICTGANRALKQIDTSNLGICVTGLLGELHNGYWTEGDVHTPPNYISSHYSDRMPLHLPEDYKKGYDNYEQMNLYEFSALLFMSSALVRQQTCEVTSPFVDVDYLDFAYRVPLKFRKDYLLTKTWMVTKYPQAAKYVWQTKRMPVDKAYYGQFYFPKFLDDCRTFAIRCVNKAGRMLNLPLQFSVRTDMNPFDLWYRTNPKLRAFINRYYTEHLDRVTDATLRADLVNVFNGSARDKLQVLNLLAVYKRYF